METFKDRVNDELSELNAKVIKLEYFLASKKFTELPRREQRRLESQLHIMNAYGAILYARIQDNFGV